MHSQLTQGTTKNTVYQFQYYFKKWYWTTPDTETRQQMKKIVDLLAVLDESTRQKIGKQLDAEFSKTNYIKGDFEATAWPDQKIRFIDFNRLLPKYIPAPALIPARGSEMSEKIAAGRTVYPGRVSGKIILISEQNLASIDFPDGSILLCDNTDVRFLPFMRKAAAIISERGGTLTHAAIIARELKKPCIVGVKDATKLFVTGDTVEIDAGIGSITKIS